MLLAVVVDLVEREGVRVGQRSVLVYHLAQLHPHERLEHLQVVPDQPLELQDHQLRSPHQVQPRVQDVLDLVVPQEHQLRLDVLVLVHVRVRPLVDVPVQVHVRSQPLQVHVVRLHELLQVRGRLHVAVPVVQRVLLILHEQRHLPALDLRVRLHRLRLQSVRHLLVLLVLLDVRQPVDLLLSDLYRHLILHLLVQEQLVNRTQQLDEAQWTQVLLLLLRRVRQVIEKIVEILLL